MIAASVNGTPWDAPPGATVADLVAACCASDRGIAVALDREVVPRGLWASRALCDGDTLEVVTAAAGG